MTVLDMTLTARDHVDKTDIEVDLDLVVARKYRATPDIVVLELHSADGGLLPAWSPGAHVDLQLGNGLARQYSLCGDTSDHGTWTIAVLREPESRGGSQYIHDVLTAGAEVKARGPRNNFNLQPANSYKFIAGGIGVTPILPMIRAAEASGTPWTLLYGGRSLETMAFRELLAEYGDRITLWPEDTHGLLDLASELRAPAEEVGIYCCGPEPLLAAIESVCEPIWPAGALHLERFRNEEATSLKGASSFTVELVQSGVSLTVPADRSILEVLLDAGVDVEASCEEGTCGTCEVEVVGGVPEHRDVVLNQEEKDSCEMMMVCVSRASGECLKLNL